MFSFLENARLSPLVNQQLDFFFCHGRFRARLNTEQLQNKVRDLAEIQTNGLKRAETKIMGPARMAAICSGLCRAMRLGTNSPNTMNKNVMPITTMAKADELRGKISTGKVISSPRNGAA